MNFESGETGTNVTHTSDEIIKMGADSPIALESARMIPLIMPGMAAAHPGHMADLAGHDHWVAGAAIGLAIALGLWGALKGGRKETDEAHDAEPQGDEAEA